MTNSYSATVVPGSSLTPTGAGVTDFQMAGNKTDACAHKVATCYGYELAEGTATSTNIGAQSLHLYNAMRVTFTFRDNITFTDNVPMTAYDYNFSLYAWNVALEPTAPDLYSPDICALCGPTGLIATQVTAPTAGNGGSITMYLNSSSYWNLAASAVGVFPEHVFQNFFVDQISTASGPMDTSLPYSQAYKTCPATCTTGATIPEWLLTLPNLEQGTGPFWLQTYCGSGSCLGSGDLAANINYQRTAWEVNATYYSFPVATSSIPFGATSDSPSTIRLMPVQEYIYCDPSVKASLCGSVSHGSKGWLPIPGANMTGTTVQVYSSTGTPEAGVTVTGLTCTTGGQCSGTLTGVSALSAGSYEVVFSTTYTSFGLARTWYQFTGFSLH